MSILRVNHNRNYTVIDNRTLTDERLSWDATGLLCWLLSRPDHWEVRVGVLTTIRNAGRDKTRRILHELQQYGYLERTKVRAEDGTFRIECVVHEVANQSGFSALVSGFSANQSGLAALADPSPDNRPLVSTDPASTKNKKKAIAPHPWPADLTLTPDMIEYAEKNGVEPWVEFEHWHDNCVSKGLKYIDWPATWRNWVRNVPRFAPRSEQPNRFGKNETARLANRIYERERDNDRARNGETYLAGQRQLVPAAGGHRDDTSLVVNSRRNGHS